MPVRLTLHPGEDVELPDAARLGDVRAALARVVRRPELLHAPLSADGTAVADDAVVGHRPLLGGATLRVTGGTAPRPSPDPEVAALRSPWTVASVTGRDAGVLRPLGPGRSVALGDVRVRIDRSGRPRVQAGGTWPRRDAPVLRREGTRRVRRRRVLGARRWYPGDQLEVVGTRYALRRSGDAAEVLAPRADIAPDVPAVRPGMLVAGAVPVVASIALAVALRQPLYALFSLVGVATLLPQVVALVRGRRQGHASRDADTRVRPAGADPARTVAQVAALHQVSDGVWRSTLARVAETARTSVVPAPAPAALDGLVPDGAIAVSGPPDPARAVARAVVLDLAATGATVEVTGPGRDRWAWCRWLASSRPGPQVLVVDGWDEQTSHHARRARDRGDVVVLCLPDRHGVAAEVPGWCRTRTTVQGDRLGRTAPDGATSLHDVVGTDDATAERTARRLAGLRTLGRSLADLDVAARRGTHHGAGGDDGAEVDPTGDDLPRAVPLADLIDPDDLATRWRTGTGWSVPVGVGRDGPVRLDLVADGPHLLVAGTTGSGKSELLQSLVLGLALTRSPADLALVLVDFKGGASFGRCADLPHVVGQVTDLEPGLAGRALAGLRAELQRRERVLATHRAASLDAAPTGTLPRLVVVMDEFRALADELPEFLPGLLRVAAQGRSLGVHLVLATQRPAGAIGADVRANVSARIALRVVDVADSHDVVGTGAAARIPLDAPGRAVLRVGAADPVVVQCAHAAAPAQDGPAVRRAEPWRRTTPGTAAADGTPAGGVVADAVAAVVDGMAADAMEADGVVADAVEADGVVADAVAATRQAAAALGLVPGPAPWLPPLPEQVTTADAAPHDDEPDAPGLLLALADDPALQRRNVVRWSPSSGHLAVVGRARSGRTTTLHALAVAALEQHWHVHALVTASSRTVFAPLRDHPGFGTLAGPDDPRRARRLLHLLTDPGPGAPAGPPVLVVVDGVEELRAALAGTDLWDPLTSALAAGRAAFAVTTDGASVGGLAARTGPRLVLLGTDQHQDVVLGAPSALAGAGGPAGRAAWLTSTGSALCQVLLPGRNAAARPSRPGTPRPHDGTGPVRLQPLPDVVVPADLDPGHPEVAAPGSTTAPVAIGVGGDGATAVHLDVAAGALVVGPRGSGRTTVLRQVVRELAARGRLGGVVSRDARLRADAGAVPVASGTPASVRAFLDATAGRPGFLVVDDLDVLAQACPVEAERLAGDGESVVLVASATTQGALMAHRGPLAELRGGRTGIALVPAERGSDEVFGTPLAAAVDPGPPRPGRGAVVRDGDVVPVQAVRLDGRPGERPDRAASADEVLDHAAGHEAHQDERGDHRGEQARQHRPEGAAGEQGEPDEQLEDLPADDDGTAGPPPPPQCPGAPRQDRGQPQEEHGHGHRDADARGTSADQLDDDGPGEGDEDDGLHEDSHHHGREDARSGATACGRRGGLRALGSGHHP